jgi:hypothetical protein
MGPSFNGSGEGVVLIGGPEGGVVEGRALIYGRNSYGFGWLSE